MFSGSYMYLFILQESGILSIGFVGLLVSTGAASAQPLFFGKVLDAATHSMGESYRHTIVV